MDQPTWERAKEIFSEAVEIPASQRSAFLDSACREDAELRAQVEALLKAHDEAGGFLASPTLTPADQVTITGLSEEPGAGEESPGARIGPYKLLQRIGEGGFGTVFMAEQVEPIHRKVALKIIKLGMDTKQVIARFEAERQALAMMDHPHIARVFDAGATETGRPYFVMELVKGVPITEYCDANNLSTRERLDLFTPVCQAVQHAHQKGIIHRDIKPSNVMVTLHDGAAVPKVIDFGIAKATHARLTERTLFTEHHQLIGTPAYMSPEQAEMSGLDVDTRTDIYSLGVLLYELLTGTTPFDSRSLHEAAYGELQRIIREVEPPKPSTRLSTLGDQVSDIARHRKAEPKTLSRLVRGDLDWIVMKALAKDRTLRYVTPAEFADDIARHLAHEPVIAGPPSVGYRARKFLRKHRVPVIAASVFLGVVVGFSVLMWILAVKNRRLAVSEAAAKEEAIAARDEARDAKDVSEEARDTAQQAENEALFESYIANVQAAATAIAANDIAGALHRLERAPEKFRNWEWDHYYREADQSIATFRTPTGTEPLALSPDGTLIAYRSKYSPGYNTIRLWDVAIGKDVATLRGHTGLIYSAVFSPDGTRIVSGSVDKTVRVWDVTTGKEVATLRGHTIGEGYFFREEQATFSPDGTRVASASYGETMLWDVDTGASVAIGSSRTVDFSPDSQHVVTASPRSVKLWNVATGSELATLLGHTYTVVYVAYSPDGTRVAASAEDGKIRIWDLGSGKELAMIEGHANTSQSVRLAFSPDGTLLVTGAGDGRIKIWDMRFATADANNLMRIRAEVANLRGHTGPIRSIAFSPDGTRVVSIAGRRDYTVKLWDLTTTVELGIVMEQAKDFGAFSTDGTRITCRGSWPSDVGIIDLVTACQLTGLRGQTSGTPIAISPDGKHFAKLVGNTVKLWDVATGDNVSTLRGHADVVPPVALSPDGARIARYRHRAHETFLLVRGIGIGSVPDLWLRTRPVGSIAFSRDGTRIAAGSVDSTIKLWDAATGKELATLRGHTGTVRSIAFSPDGTRMASESVEDTAKLWDAVTGKEIATLRGHTDDLSCLAFSPDGKQIATGSMDTTVKLWDAFTGVAIATLRGHTDGVRCLAFSSNGKRITSGSADRTMRLWDVATCANVSTSRWHIDKGEIAAFSPNGKRVAYRLDDETVSLWDVDTSTKLATRAGYTVAFSADGQRVATGGASGQIWNWDLTTGANGHLYPGSANLNHTVVFSPDGTRIAWSVHDTTGVWDVTTGANVSILRGHTDRVSTFSPDGTRIASVSDDKTTIKLWDAATGKELVTLRGRTGTVSSIAFSPDGTRIASGYDYDTAKLWDVITGKELATLRVNSLECFAFSSDGKQIATGSVDTSVRLWDAFTGKEIATLRGHSDNVFCLAFSPDGTRIVSGSVDSTVKLWDVARGREVVTLRGHAGGIGWVTFSPDGTRIAAGGRFNNRVKIWDTVSYPQRSKEAVAGYVAALGYEPDQTLFYTRRAIGMAQVKQRLKNYAEAESILLGALATCEDHRPRRSLADRHQILKSLEELYAPKAMDRPIKRNVVSDLREYSDLSGAAALEGSAVPATRIHAGLETEFNVLGQALNLLRLGLQSSENGRHTEAVDFLHDALDVVQELVADVPDVVGYRDARDRILRRLVELLLAEARTDMSTLLADMGQEQELTCPFGHATEVIERLVTDFPSNESVLWLLHQAYMDGGDAFRESGRAGLAEKTYLRAFDRYEELKSNLPDAPAYRARLGANCQELADSLKKLGLAQESARAYHQAYELYEELESDLLDKPGYRARLGANYQNLAIALHELGLDRDAERACHHAIGVRESLVAGFPAVPEYQFELVSSYRTLSDYLADTDRFEEAAERCVASVDLLEKLVQAHPDDPAILTRLSATYERCADHLEQAGLVKQAEAARRKALAMREQSAAEGVAQLSEPALSAASSAKWCPVANFDGHPVGGLVRFNRVHFSLSTSGHLKRTPHVSTVTHEVPAYDGVFAYKVQWAFKDWQPKRWLRLTTYQEGNPAVDLDRPIRIRLRLDQGPLRVCLGIRETGVDVPIGMDGETSGTIEWVGADSAIGYAPQGILVMPKPGVWQTLTFAPQPGNVTPFTGDGVLHTENGKGVLEHIAFTVVDNPGPFTVYIDATEQECATADAGEDVGRPEQNGGTRGEE